MCGHIDISPVIVTRFLWYLVGFVVSEGLPWATGIKESFASASALSKGFTSVGAKPRGWSDGFIVALQVKAKESTGDHSE